MPFAKDHSKRNDRQREEAQRLREELLSWRSRAKPVASKASGSGADSSKGVRPPTQLPAKITVEALTPLLPPQAQLFESSTESRIPCILPSVGSRLPAGASLELYGMRNACLWCLQWAWEVEHDLHGTE